MEFTAKEKLNGEMAVRDMSKKAFEAYSGVSPLTIYEKETDEGKRYYMQGALEYDNRTFKEMEMIFEDMYDDAHITDAEMNALVSYMDDDIRERVHMELAPCTHEEFLIRYIELDPELEKVMEDEFSVALDKLNLYR